ncbi:MAG: hypothetical protein AVDCRST_MAG11-3289, partial [uncultured Gemmatimonadaceae bacterium]
WTTSSSTACCGRPRRGTTRRRRRRRTRCGRPCRRAAPRAPGAVPPSARR